jgi:putative transposase
MRDFIDAYRGAHGVKPICKVLQISPSGYHRYAAQRRDPSLRPARAKPDDALVPQIERVWQSNMQVYGADKVWRQLAREGIPVARVHRRAADAAAGPARCSARQGGANDDQ